MTKKIIIIITIIIIIITIIIISSYHHIIVTVIIISGIIIIITIIITTTIITIITRIRNIIIIIVIIIFFFFIGQLSSSFDPCAFSRVEASFQKSSTSALFLSDARLVDHCPSYGLRVVIQTVHFVEGGLGINVWLIRLPNTVSIYVAPMQTCQPGECF